MRQPFGHLRRHSAALGGARRSARAATPPGPKSVTVSPRAHLVVEGRASRLVIVGELRCVREKDFCNRWFLASFLIAIATLNDALKRRVSAWIYFRYNSNENRAVWERTRRGREWEEDKRLCGPWSILQCVSLRCFPRFLVADLYYVNDRVCR